MRNAKDGERKGYWGEKPIQHVYMIMVGVEERKFSKESFNRVFLDRILWRRHEVGSGTVLVHSLNKTADDRSEDFKDIFSLKAYGSFKGCRGRVGGLFLFNSLLNTYKNVRNCQMLPSF